MANPSTVKHIMRTWISKSKSEDDIFNKFIELWIAFNAYYVSATGEQTDREAIVKIKGNADLKSYYGSISSSKAAVEFEGISPVKNLKNGNEIYIAKEDFETVIDAIYQIRNNLFHGGKSEFVERDNTVVSKAIPILEKLVSYCYTKFDELVF